MSRGLFTSIVEEVTNKSTYVRDNVDCTRREGISELMKCTSVIHKLAYDTIPNALDEYLHMGAMNSRQSLDYISKYVMETFGAKYLRKPTYMDVEKLYAFRKQKKGFPGTSNPFILLEAIASQELWMSHAFFGVFEESNDINVIHQCPLFTDLKDGNAPKVLFMANDAMMTTSGYNINEWMKRKGNMWNGLLVFSRKKWAILANPTRLTHLERIRIKMYTCIISHNMIRKHKNVISPDWYLEEAHQLDDTL
ncbi:ALP1-like protein isoform X1 [Tanacetum coccineum]